MYVWHKNRSKNIGAAKASVGFKKFTVATVLFVWTLCISTSSIIWKAPLLLFLESILTLFLGADCSHPVIVVSGLNNQTQPEKASKILSWGNITFLISSFILGSHTQFHFSISKYFIRSTFFVSFLCTV